MYFEILSRFSCQVLMVILSNLSIYAQESCLTITADDGPYHVGFDVIYSSDRSRSFISQNNDQDVDFRPIQACIWYPSQADPEQKPLLYEDYFFLKAHETGEVTLHDSLTERIISEFLRDDPVDSSRFYYEMAIETNAHWKASPAGGDFPVMIYGPSWWSTAFENAMLFEFLASHGYVILSSPSMGPDKREMPLTAIGMETQARDMEFLLNVASDFPNANISDLAVAGFSWGGLSNVIMAARHREVDAWIGLDPSIHEAYDLFDYTSYDDYSRFTIPTLFVNTAGYMNDLPFYDRLVHSDAYVINMPALEHTDLASQFIRLMKWRDRNPETLRIKNLGYNVMCNNVLAFLNHIFKTKEEDVSVQWFVQQDTLQGFVQLRKKEALPLPGDVLKWFQIDSMACSDFLLSESKNHLLSYPESEIQQMIYLALDQNKTFLADELLQWYQTHNPESFPNLASKFINAEQLKIVYNKIYETNDPCSFSYDNINHTGHVLFMSNNGKEGISYFELNERLHPDNYRAQFNLGLGYFWLDRPEEAKLHFQQCLKLHPDDRYKGLAEDFLAKL